jgi:hypothetical protein
MGLESLCEVFCVYLPQVYTSPEGGGSMAVKMFVPSYQMTQYNILESQLCLNNCTDLRHFKFESQGSGGLQ